MNKFKYEPVTDITVGQVIDAIFDGEWFYLGEIPLTIFIGLSGMHMTAHMVRMDIMNLKRELENGNITRKVEIDWRDQLDGSWDNGVWCMCWNDGGARKLPSKISKFDGFGHSSNSGDYYQNATPLPQQLADQLEALSEEP